MLRVVVGCCVALTAACYDPSIECPFGTCLQPVGDSPTDAAIGSDAGDAGDAGVADGAPAPDASPPKVCAPGCAGTCDDGVCVIECIGTEACDQEVVCPLTGPCRVACVGRKACEQGVRCGLGPCTVTCNGNEACRKRVRCEASCACDVTCGPDACKDDAVCPKPWCAAGDGCTSVPNSCSSC